MSHRGTREPRDGRLDEGDICIKAITRCFKLPVQRRRRLMRQIGKRQGPFVDREIGQRPVRGVQRGRVLEGGSRFVPQVASAPVTGTCQRVDFHRNARDFLGGPCEQFAKRFRKCELGGR